MEDTLRYPIGKFNSKAEYTQSELDQFISRIASLPARLESEVLNLSASQLDTPYREDGWTVRQLIHHIADSHLSAYIRYKWALTEDTPVIKAYDEKKWAETPETKAEPTLSLALVSALHAKWVVLLKQLTATDLKKEFIHPDTKKQVRLDNMMGMYAWHGDHHLAHITSLKSRMGW